VHAICMASASGSQKDLICSKMMCGFPKLLLW